MERTVTRATFTIAVVSLCIAATAPKVVFVSPCELSERQRHKRRKASRDKRSIEFQHSLRTGLSREFGRMGAAHGYGSRHPSLPPRNVNKKPATSAIMVKSIKTSRLQLVPLDMRIGVPGM